MLERPLLFPFQTSMNRGFSPFRKVDMVEAGPQSLLNAQKLSLAANTAVGTQVSVTDGFVVSGFGDARDGFYFFDVANGGSGQSARYLKQLPFIDDGSDVLAYYEHGWHIGSGSLGLVHGPSDVGTDPWDTTYDICTLTHPAIQQLTAPSTAQGGVFAVGGTQDGVYVINGTQGGRTNFPLLGVTDARVSWSIDRWSVRDTEGAPIYYSLSNVATPDLAGSDKITMVVNGTIYTKRGTFNGKSYYNDVSQPDSTSHSAIFWSSATWHITNLLGVDLDTSTSAVATPDLATFLLGTVVTNVAWLNASDDSPASITVTTFTQGQLVSGIQIGDDTYQVNGNENGRLKYSDVLGAQPDIAWLAPDEVGDNLWRVRGFQPINVYNVAFPWQGTPEVPVTADAVASEVNWGPIP